jgi:hypothetical protein
MKRYLHNKSHYHLIGTKMGLLNVVGSFEALPGDTVQIQNSGLIRVTPPATPVMHPVTVKFYNFFVPYRILDPSDGSFEWEKFITGGEDGNYVTPPPRAAGVTVAKGTIADQCGITPGVRNYNTFAMKAYAKIWNEYFRDQQLQAEIDIDSYDGSATPQRVAWERDYFTSCRPDDLLGPEVTLPLGTKAPVAVDNPAPATLTIQDPAGPDTLMPTASTNLQSGAQAGTPNEGNRLYADLSAATAINVNDLREAFALQRYQEARNMYGARFTEYLRYLGISSSDGRLQRPEMISSGKSVINFSEVLNTADDGSGTTLAPLGKLGGHGIAGVRSRRARYFCEEHGQVISLMSVRPKSMYMNTQHKMFDRLTKEDYWQKELQAIGMEEVYASELNVDATDPTAVFGFNNRYESFKRIPSRVSGDFRDLLESWHMARDDDDVEADQALNADFVECNPTNRIYVDTAADTDKLWCTVRNRVAVRSMLRKSTQNFIL